MEKTVKLGFFLAVALILSYVESLIPFSFGIPGIKLGLPNLAVVLLLYRNGIQDALTVNVLRIMLAGFLFGSLYSVLYALAGARRLFLAGGGECAWRCISQYRAGHCCDACCGDILCWILYAVFDCRRYGYRRCSRSCGVRTYAISER